MLIQILPFGFKKPIDFVAKATGFDSELTFVDYDKRRKEAQLRIERMMPEELECSIFKDNILSIVKQKSSLSDFEEPYLSVACVKNTTLAKRIDLGKSFSEQ